MGIRGDRSGRLRRPLLPQGRLRLPRIAAAANFIRRGGPGQGPGLPSGPGPSPANSI